MEDEFLKIYYYDLPKEVKEYLGQFEDPTEEAIRMLDVGLAVLKRVELTRDVEYIKKEAKNIVMGFERTVAVMLKNFGDDLVTTLSVNFDPSVDTSYLKKTGDFLRNELKDFKTGVNDTTKIVVENAEKVSTSKLTDVNNSLNDIGKKLNPNDTTSYLGILQSNVFATKDHILDTLNATKEGTFANMLKRGLEKYFGDSSPILEVVQNKLDNLHVSVQEEIVKLREEIAEKKGQSDMMSKTAIKGFKFEDELEDVLDTLSKFQSDICVRVSASSEGSSLKGDFVYEFSEGPRLVIEAKDTSIGLKPTLEYLDEAMKTRSVDFSIVVTKENEQLPKSVRMFNLYEGNKLFCSATGLELALRFARLYLTQIKGSDSTEINTADILVEIEKIQNSLKNINTIKAKLTNMTKFVTSTSVNVAELLDDVSDNISFSAKSIGRKYRMKPRQIIFEKVKGLKFTDGDTYVQLKYDGSQYHLHVKNLKPYALTSKRNSVKTGVLSEKLDHFPNLDYMDFTNETIIVVEVVSEHLDIPQNERCTKVASIMNSNIENIVYNDLRMVAHDFLYFEGTDVRTLPYSKRYELLHTCFPSAGWYGENIGVRNHTVYAVENIPLDEFYEGVDIPSVVDFQEYVNSDFFKWEGLVLKDSAEPMKMLKIKRIKTVDCFITGYTEGAGKYSGLVGSLKVGVWDKASIKEIATVSGFDDYLREEISAYKEDYLDHVLEVSYMEWTGSRLRHPRFKRLRDDKEHSKCTIDQLEE